MLFRSYGVCTGQIVPLLLHTKMRTCPSPRTWSVAVNHQGWLPSLVYSETNAVRSLNPSKESAKRMPIIQAQPNNSPICIHVESLPFARQNAQPKTRPKPQALHLLHHHNTQNKHTCSLSFSLFPPPSLLSEAPRRECASVHALQLQTLVRTGLRVVIETLELAVASAQAHVIEAAYSETAAGIVKGGCAIVPARCPGNRLCRSLPRRVH